MGKELRKEFIDRWAEFVKNNSTEVWKPMHTQFINAQIEKATAFYEYMKKTRGEKEARKLLH